MSAVTNDQLMDYLVAFAERLPDSESRDMVFEAIDWIDHMTALLCEVHPYIKERAEAERLMDQFIGKRQRYVDLVLARINEQIGE